MVKILWIGSILGLLISGCATSEKVSEADISRLNNRISILENELSQKQKENLILKERIAELEQTVIKMPTAVEIQTALKNANFYQGKIDGRIGPETKKAIRKFQEVNNLNPDGIMGSRTWKKLAQFLKSKKEE